MPPTREFSDRIPVGRLIVQKACIEVAVDRLKEIYEGNEIAASILLELQIAAKLAEVFNETWSSIYWIEARKRTRDRVKMTLKDIAAKIIDHVEEAMTLFDELCDEQDANPTLELTNGWIGFQAGLDLIKRDLQYHDDFVKRNSIEYLPLLKLIEKKSEKRKMFTNSEICANCEKVAKNDRLAPTTSEK